MDMRTTHVVVGVEGAGNGNALNTLECAAEEARLRQWPLRLVHAVDLRQADSTSRGFALLQAAAERVRRRHPGLPVSTVLGLGLPGDVLLHYVGDCGLLVLGSHGRAELAGVRSSVALHLLPRIHMPALIVRVPAQPTAPGLPGRPVVVGVDGTPAANAAVTAAAEEARLRSAPLIAVHASHRSMYADRRPEPLLSGPMGDEAVLDGLEVLRLHMDAEPRAALVALSRQASVVAVGGRGRGGLTGFLLGSVGQALIRRAHCPVLIARSESRVARLESRVARSESRAAPSPVLAVGRNALASSSVARSWTAHEDRI
jgi:nucleotide-binding universal stress UspA family protein